MGFFFSIFITVHKIRHILVSFLCIFWFSSYSQSYTPSNSFIKSIEHGVYIDHRFTYPYTQLSLTTNSGLYLEAGMLDIPGDINIHFNSTIQNRAGNLAYLINNMEEPVGYHGNPYSVYYYSIGYSSNHGKYRQVLQTGYSSKDFMIKTSHYYRVIDVGGGFLDLGCHLQFGEQRKFIFFGYSWGIDLAP